MLSIVSKFNPSTVNISPGVNVPSTWYKSIWLAENVSVTYPLAPDEAPTTWEPTVTLTELAMSKIVNIWISNNTVL